MVRQDGVSDFFKELVHLLSVLLIEILPSDGVHEVTLRFVVFVGEDVILKIVKFLSVGVMFTRS